MNIKKELCYVTCPHNKLLNSYEKNAIEREGVVCDYHYTIGLLKHIIKINPLNSMHCALPILFSTL